MSELPEGYKPVSEEDRKRAKAFFDRGVTVAGTGQYDYAIEMFMNGFNLDPDAVDAHQLLRDISLRRKASGGKSLGMFEKMKIKTNTKDDKANMLAAVKLLAFDPGNTEAMLVILNSAFSAGYYDTVMWIGPILHRANTDGGKPDISKYTKLKDVYRALKQWELAVGAAQAAVAMRPEDMDLVTELKHLGAEATMSRGNYDKKDSNFRGSIKDAAGQQKLIDADRDIRDVDVLTRQLMDAEAEWKAQPNETGKLMKYVEALLKTEKPENEDRAVEVLSEAHQKTGQFRFRLNVGKIKLAQLARMDRSMREKVAKNPNDAAVREEAAAFARDKVEEELKEFTLFSENYPTDLTYKYEMARRFYALGRHGEAIPVLQSARQDPKLRTDASIMLGRAFLEAEFVDEAVETLKAIIDDYALKGDEKSKQMYYWYARSLEAHGDFQPAIKAYSQLAQWDFNFRDVQTRIKKLRSGGNPPPAQ